MKLDEYRRRDGLAYIVLIDSRRAEAALWTRTQSDWETASFEGRVGVFDLPEIGCRLAMSDIYDGLNFDTDRPA